MSPDPYWRERAACRDADSSLFYPAVTGPSPDSRAAKKICAGCEVRVDCLKYALAHREGHGIWGGLTAHERAAVNQTRRAI